MGKDAPGMDAQVSRVYGCTGATAGCGVRAQASEPPLPAKKVPRHGIKDTERLSPLSGPSSSPSPFPNFKTGRGGRGVREQALETQKTLPQKKVPRTEIKDTERLSPLPGPSSSPSPFPIFKTGRGGRGVREQALETQKGFLYYVLSYMNTSSFPICFLTTRKQIRENTI